MGEAELLSKEKTIWIRSSFILYGDAASEALASQLAFDISSHWNEPNATVLYKKERYVVRFDVQASYVPDLPPEEVWYNDDPRLNYFRVEEYVIGDISFVDGLNCNTGYFKLANLAQTSTTAAHEYGHTLGLDHPDHLDIRGQGSPGIMYPRGSIVDPCFQYSPDARPGDKGGTLDPKHRRVVQSDIDALKIHRLDFSHTGKVMIGGFSSIYHEKHFPPPVSE